MTFHPPRRPHRHGAPSPHAPHAPAHPTAKHPPAAAKAANLPLAFTALGLVPTLVRALGDEGYEHPTPVQSQAIPPALEGRDLLGVAQTGTGKTAAFVLPILQRLSGRPGQGRIRSLVLTPTRELASQIAERATAYGRHLNLRHTVIFGGVGQQRQEQALRGRLDLVVATPGRLIDLMQQRFVNLSAVEIFVLDEADRMLDMGFLPDVRRIIAALPAVRQTLLFSATMPPAISGLANGILENPVRVSIAPTVTTAESVDQVLYHVPKAQKHALFEQLLRGPGMTRVIAFTRTKRGADRLFVQLERAGFSVAVIHGNKSQNARERALGGFRDGRTRVLIATDIAARGIDVDGISHVVNYDLPDVAESYVHRIGRTGRAGALGSAIAFCDPAERGLLQDVERFIRHPIPLAPGQIAPTGPIPPPAGKGGKGGKPGGGQRKGGRPQGGGGGRPQGGGGRHVGRTHRPGRPRGNW